MLGWDVGVRKEGAIVGDTVGARSNSFRTLFALLSVTNMTPFVSMNIWYGS
jgi:hypothetical protein